MKKTKKRSPNYSLVRTFSDRQRQRQQRQNTNLSFVELWQKIKSDSELQYLMIAIITLNIIILIQDIIFYKPLQGYKFNGLDLCGLGIFFMFYIYAQVKPAHSKNKQYK